MTNREQILEAVLELASEKGLSAISMSQIAKRVGIQKATLYSHFKSKAEIIESLYQFLREQAKQMQNDSAIDYGELVEGRTMEDVLLSITQSYEEMNAQPKMAMFYRLIMSERAVSKEAADIMVLETETMICATKQLFYAMQVKHTASFDHVDMAAVSFAMAVHSLQCYFSDLEMSGRERKEELMREYIHEFCSVYSR